MTPTMAAMTPPSLSAGMRPELPIEACISSKCRLTCTLSANKSRMSTYRLAQICSVYTQEGTSGNEMERHIPMLVTAGRSNGRMEDVVPMPDCAESKGTVLSTDTFGWSVVSTDSPCNDAGGGIAEPDLNTKKADEKTRCLTAVKRRKLSFTAMVIMTRPKKCTKHNTV